MSAKLMMLISVLLPVLAVAQEKPCGDVPDVWSGGSQVEMLRCFDGKVTSGVFAMPHSWVREWLGVKRQASYRFVYPQEYLRAPSCSWEDLDGGSIEAPPTGSLAKYIDIKALSGHVIRWSCNGVVRKKS